MYDEIIYEVDDPVATITLNRPEALNAWTNHMAAEVRDAMGRAERDRNVVGIVLTGAGRGFCAGADMKMLSGISSGEGGGDDPTVDNGLGTAGDPSWGDDLRGEYTYLLSVPKPIIAAINGPIAGMAVPIALACDLRFMAPDAVLTVAFSQRGLIAEWGVGWLLPRLVGTGAALDLLWSSRRIDGTEAERMGLVNRVVPADELLATARAYITELGRALLAGVDRGDEAAGVPGHARRPGRRRARGPSAHGRELRPPRLRRRGAVVPAEAATRVRPHRRRLTATLPRSLVLAPR